MGILIILIGVILVWLVTRGNHSQNNTNNTAIQKNSPSSKDDETVKATPHNTPAASSGKFVP